MLDYDFLVISGDYRKQYENFPLPVVICDRRWVVYWSNEAAKRSYPAATETAGLSALLGEYDLPSLLEQVEQESSCTIADAIPLAGVDISLLPLRAGGEMAGVVVMLIGAQTLPAVGAGYRTSRTAEALGRTVRSTVEDMFDAMDSASAKAALFQAGWVNQTFAKVSAGAYRILRIADNLSAYTRFQSGVESVSLRRLDLAELLEQSGDILSGIGDDLGIPVNLQIPETPCPVAGDRATLETALFNLIHNSFFFTRPGNRLDITLALEEGDTVLTVADRGVGIPAPHLGEVWRPYASFSHKGIGTAGIGLGLAVVRAVADAHRARIQLESEEGVGVTVTLRFPPVPPDTPLGLGQEIGRSRMDHRFSRVYVGLADAVDSPYRE